jgi:hypothetical protein
LPQAPGAAAASGLGGFELLLPARQGKISVTGWTVEHATQLLRVLKEVGFPFDGNAVVHELPGMNGGLEPEGGPSDAAVA